MSRQLNALERTTILGVVNTTPLLRKLLQDPESCDALCEFLQSLYLPDVAPMPRLSGAEESTVKSLTSKVKDSDLGKQFAKIDEGAFKRYMEGGHNE